MKQIASTLKQHTQRGFTLIEIALVLVISGIVVTYLVNAFLNVQRIERNESTTRQIEVIKKAIVSYAANNKTAGREIYLQSGTDVRRVIMPAGRPYLPCPDITGDGLEDRVALPNPTDPLTLTLTDANAARTAYQSADANALKNYALWNPGSCMSSRGIVPWRTLGVPSEDPWGNRYTYRVMPSFAGAVHGFDQNTPAINVGSVFPMIPSEATVTVTTIENKIMVTNRISRFIMQAPISELGGKYQSDLAATVIQQSGPNHVFVAPAIVCSQSPCPPTDLANYEGEIVAGDVSESSATLSFPKLVDYAGEGDITVVFGSSSPKIAGVPFVVLSHGRNGHGAVIGNDDVYRCNGFPAPPTNPPPPLTPRLTILISLAMLSYNAERTNAVFSNASNTNCSTITAQGQDASNAALDYGFVAGINHGVWADGDFVYEDFAYDDIVSWMSADELSEDLSELDVFPAHALPLLIVNMDF